MSTGWRIILLGTPLTFNNYETLEKRAVDLEILLENLLPALTAGEERELVKSAFKQLREETANKKASTFNEFVREVFVDC